MHIVGFVKKLYLCSRFTNPINLVHMRKEEFLELLHGLQTSGSTVKEYCKQKGIPVFSIG